MGRVHSELGRFARMKRRFPGDQKGPPGRGMMGRGIPQRPNDPRFATGGGGMKRPAAD